MVVEGLPWERRALGREVVGEGHSLPHPFFVFTEKQQSRDLPGLPNLEPGEGEPGGWVQEWEDPKPLGWSKRTIEHQGDGGACL